MATWNQSDELPENGESGSRSDIEKPTESEQCVYYVWCIKCNVCHFSFLNVFQMVLLPVIYVESTQCRHSMYNLSMEYGLSPHLLGVLLLIFPLARITVGLLDLGSEVIFCFTAQNLRHWFIR